MRQPTMLMVTLAMMLILWPAAAQGNHSFDTSSTSVELVGVDAAG